MSVKMSVKMNKTVKANNKVFWPNCVSFYDRLIPTGNSEGILLNEK